MKIAIIGTRGIPNHYGGFEQCAEYLALGLLKKGYEITVYNSHDHPWKDNEWKGIKIMHCYDPEYKYGTAGQFIYDRNCIKDLRKHSFDIVLQLGYTSSSIWGWMLPKNIVVTTNMDGLEWKRTKYSKPVRRFLKFAEKLGVKYSDHLISDSIGIQTYLTMKYHKDSVYIPYGADLFTNPDQEVLKSYDLVPYQYDLLIARLEPENSIEIILEGVVKANLKRPFLVIGKHETKYGEYLKDKFKNSIQIRFVGAIYDIQKLNNIRFYSNLYFHGHTVGGTNPSLLEAMASNALICAQDNLFNKSILGEDAFYFNTSDEIKIRLLTVEKQSSHHQTFLTSNSEKIQKIYAWDKIVDQYARHFENIKGVFKR